MSISGSSHNLIASVSLLDEQQTIDRIFTHIDEGTTDLGDTVWREPVENYHSQERFDAEIALLRRRPVPFCPSAALPDNGSYIARKAAGTPLVVARGRDGVVRAFINACRHRGMQVAIAACRSPVAVVALGHLFAPIMLGPMTLRGNSKPYAVRRHFPI